MHHLIVKYILVTLLAMHNSGINRRENTLAVLHLTRLIQYARRFSQGDIMSAGSYIKVQSLATLQLQRFFGSGQKYFGHRQQKHQNYDERRQDVGQTL